MRALSLSALLGWTALASAQPATQRTPNLEGTWITPPWNLHFQFNHRFKIGGGDLFGEGKVINWPSFGLSLGLWEPFAVGVKYASRPEVGLRSNEWFPYAKVSPWSAADGRVSLSLLGGYDTAMESWDGEVSAQAEVSRILATAVLRGMTRALATDSSGTVIGGGLTVQVNRYVSLAGDAAKFVVGPDLKAGWSAGLQIAIPYTPHTLSLQVTNTRSTLLQGASWSSDGELVYGFEFTIPFTGFARWGKIAKPDEEVVPAAPAPEAQPAPAPATPKGAVVEIEVQGLKFHEAPLKVRPGTTVRWVNGDLVAHTITADDGSWGSALLESGESFSRTFELPGRYAYHCEPHPFMIGTIVVEEA